MDICFISKQFNPAGGGSERYAYEITRALTRRGHHVEVFTLGRRDEFHNHDFPDELSVTFIGNRRRKLVTFETLFFSIVTKLEVNLEQFDVIHSTLMPASSIALSIGNYSIPMVVTSHGTSVGEIQSHKLEVPTDYLKKFAFHPMNLFMDIVTALNSSRVIAISSHSQDELEKYYPIDSEHINRISHGVNDTRFRPDYDRHPAVSPNKCTLLHVGRLVSSKHVDLALHAVKQISRDTDIELIIAGDGTHRDRLVKITKALDIENIVRFLGFVPEDELPPLYASSDVFLLCSRYEGFGLTFLEAMSSGTPVIGTPVGGFPDLVTHNKSGIIVDHDSTDMATAIERIVSSDELLSEMSTEARRVAKSQTWDAVAAETEAVYNSVIIDS